MKYGLRDSVLASPSLDEKFAAAAEIGFDGLEVIVPRDFETCHLWRPGGIEELREMAARTGVEICSISLGAFSRLSFLAPDPEMRRTGEKILGEAIGAASGLGIPVILVPMFSIPVDDPLTPPLIEGLRRFGEEAGRRRVCLAIETNLGAEALLRVLDAVGLDSVRVYQDTANNLMRWGYDPAEEIRRLGKAIAQIHIKDTDRNPLGQGRVNFQAVGQAIREIGYDGYLVLETPRGDDPEAMAKRHLRFMKELV